MLFFSQTLWKRTLLLYSCLVQVLGRLEHSRVGYEFNKLDEEYNGSSTSIEGGIYVDREDSMQL